MPRCKVCNKQCAEESMYVYNGLDVYCCSEQCFTSFLDGEKKKEDRNYCYATISRIFGVKPLTPKLLAEVKRTCENENLTYRNLAAVLHYMYDIKHVPIYSPTLYYVPQHKDAAKEYFLSLKQKEKEAEALIKKDKERNSSIVKPNYKTNKRKTGLKINPEDV